MATAADILFGTTEEEKKKPPSSAADLLFGAPAQDGETVPPAPPSPPSISLTQPSLPGGTAPADLGLRRIDQPVPALQERMTATERSLAAQGGFMRLLFDMLSRGQYLSANVAEAIIEGRFEDIPADAWAGITGRKKGDFINLFHQYGRDAVQEFLVSGLPALYRANLPQEAIDEITDAALTVLGTGANIALDPLNYVGIGALGRVDEAGDVGRQVLSFAGRSLLPRSWNDAIIGAVNRLADSARHTRLARWLRDNIGRRFNAAADFPDRELYEAYVDMQSEVRYLINVADQNRIPRAQAVAQIEQELGIPRAQITELIERPIIESPAVQPPLPMEIERQVAPAVPEQTVPAGQPEEVFRRILPAREEVAVQPPLPLTERVMTDPGAVNPSPIPFDVQEEVLGYVNRQVETAIVNTQGALPRGYTREFGRIRTPEDVARAKDTIAELYMHAMADRLRSGVDDPALQRFAVSPEKIERVLRDGDKGSQTYRELYAEAVRQLDAGTPIPEFPSEWQDVWDTLTLLEMPEFQTIRVRTERVPITQTRIGEPVEPLRFPTFEERPVGEETEVFRRQIPAREEVGIQEPLPMEITTPAQPARFESVPIGREYTIPRTIDRLSGMPDPVRTTVQDFWEWAGGPNRPGGRIGLEQAAGVDISALQDEIEYMSHYLTDEARAFMRTHNIEEDTVRQRLIPGEIQHRSTQERSTRNLTIQEINELGEQGRIIPGFRGRVLEDDPVKLDRMRDLLYARAVALAHFMDTVKANPRWAFHGEDAPLGFVELTGAAAERLGRSVEGWKFAPEVAETLTKVVERTFDPEKLSELTKGLDAAMGLWRVGTLTSRAVSWIRDNMIGNAWNAVVLAGNTNPANWTDAARILTAGRRGAFRHQVRQGQTLSEIAEAFGLSVDDIARANNITDPDRIIAGQTLVIPAGDEVAGRTAAEWIDLAERHGVINRGLYGQQLAEVMDSASTAARLGQAISGYNPVFRLNQAIENHARMALFIDAIKKGRSPQDAAAWVRRYLFDYGELADWEKEKVRRYFAFYTWFRKEIPLLLEHSFTTPGRNAIIPKTITAYEADTERLQSLDTAPDYIQEGLYAQAGNRGPGGMVNEFISLRGLPPSVLYETVQDPLGVFFGANPAINALSILRGYNLRFNEPIPADQTEELFGVPVSRRTAEALYEVIPFLRQADAFFDPYEDLRREVMGTQQDMSERLAELLTGRNVILRNRYMDLRSAINALDQRRQGIERNMERALLNGDADLAERYFQQAQEIAQAQAELIEQFGLLEAAGPVGQ